MTPLVAMTLTLIYQVSLVSASGYWVKIEYFSASGCENADVKNQEWQWADLCYTSSGQTQKYTCTEGGNYTLTYYSDTACTQGASPQSSIPLGCTNTDSNYWTKVACSNVDTTLQPSQFVTSSLYAASDSQCSGTVQFTYNQDYDACMKQSDYSTSTTDNTTTGTWSNPMYQKFVPNTDGDGYQVNSYTSSDCSGNPTGNASNPSSKSCTLNTNLNMYQTWGTPVAAPKTGGVSLAKSLILSIEAVAIVALTQML